MDRGAPLRTRIASLAIVMASLVASKAQAGMVEPPSPIPPPIPAKSPAAPKPVAAPKAQAADQSVLPMPMPDKAAAEPPPTLPPILPEVATALPDVVRVETAEALKALELPAEAETKDAKPALLKERRELLGERLRILDELEKASRERYEVEHPDPDPKTQIEQLKGELEKTGALIAQAAKDPKALLPECFSVDEAKIDDAALTLMKEAIEAATGEAKDTAAKVEKGLALEPNKSANALRAERDKLQQRRDSLIARRAEREKTLASAVAADARDLARQRLVNLSWEQRLEAERQAILDAKATLDPIRAELAALTAQCAEADLAVARKGLERMKAKHQKLADHQREKLKREAAIEQTRAKRANDPLERHKGKRKAEMLDLEAAVLNDENSLANSSGLSLDELKERTAVAEKRRETSKKMVELGRGGGLIAVRLKNDYKTISKERELLRKNDLAYAAGRMDFYENLRTDVEMELLNDGRDDRYELDSLLEHLPESRHDEATAEFSKIEQEHRKFLERRLKALASLAERYEAIYAEIQKRIEILDEHYAYIRTHLFWVRDTEPIGVQTISHTQQEAKRIVPALVALALEPWDAKRWRGVSVEFAIAVLACIAAPLPLYRLQKALGRRLPHRMHPVEVPLTRVEPA
ncbi:hypothetical protein EP7_003979 [Isosphaeraceae bacterium EP7]